MVDIARPEDSKELPPCIIRKSDGAALYATSDLGTILEREKDFAPVKYIYITDKRQELHFIQVFRVAKLAGYVKEETPMVHIGFGTMNGKDGKPFKTREEEAGRTAKIVGLAALKYGDLSNQAAKDYVFDLDRFTSFEGNTGPYILYTIVRIKSILAKYETMEKKPAGESKVLPAASGAEKALMLELARFNEVLENAFQETAPHKICQYIYGLSDAFNSFYHDTRILSQEDSLQQAGWIRLITLVKEVLTACSQVLGFEAPERM